jgi:hypothetical protein
MLGKQCKDAFQQVFAPQNQVNNTPDLEFTGYDIENYVS